MEKYNYNPITQDLDMTGDGDGDVINNYGVAWNDETPLPPQELEWGGIVGDIDDQTDLKDELDGLSERITNLQNIGRFLSIWNATTGVAESTPPSSPYIYKTGDYFRVGAPGDRIPKGTSYTTGGTNYETTTEQLATGDVFYFDGTVWRRQAAGSGGTVTDVKVGGVSVVTNGVAHIPTVDLTCDMADGTTKTLIINGTLS